MLFRLWSLTRSKALWIGIKKDLIKFNFNKIKFTKKNLIKFIQHIKYSLKRQEFKTQILSLQLFRVSTVTVSMSTELAMSSEGQRNARWTRGFMIKRSGDTGTARSRHSTVMARSRNRWARSWWEWRTSEEELGFMIKEYL